MKKKYWCGNLTVFNAVNKLHLRVGHPGSTQVWEGGISVRNVRLVRKEKNEMVSNIAFTEKEHFCLICGREINMMRVKNLINAALHDFTPKTKLDDPFILEKDHGNDLMIVCSWKCYLKYLHVDWNKMTKKVIELTDIELKLLRYLLSQMYRNYSREFAAIDTILDCSQKQKLNKMLNALLYKLEPASHDSEWLFSDHPCTQLNMDWLDYLLQAAWFCRLTHESPLSGLIDSKIILLLSVYLIKSASVKYFVFLKIAYCPLSPKIML